MNTVFGHIRHVNSRSRRVHDRAGTRRRLHAQLRQYRRVEDSSHRPCPPRKGPAPIYTHKNMTRNYPFPTQPSTRPGRSGGPPPCVAPVRHDDASTTTTSAPSTENQYYFFDGAAGSTSGTGQIPSATSYPVLAAHPVPATYYGGYFPATYPYYPGYYGYPYYPGYSPNLAADCGSGCRSVWERARTLNAARSCSRTVRGGRGPLVGQLCCGGGS